MCFLITNIIEGRALIWLKKNKIRYFSSHNIKKTKIIDFINQHINSCTYLGNHNDILIKKFL